MTRRADRAWFTPGDLEGVRDGYFGLACAVLKQAAKDAIDPEASPLKRLDARLFLADAGLWFEALGLEFDAQNVLYLLTESGRVSRALARAEK